MQEQITDYIDKFLSQFLCDYRKGLSTQTALMHIVEKFKLFLDSKGVIGAILMDLSKAFDTINHEFLIAILAAYCFSKNSFKINFELFEKWWQRVNINSSYSSWSEILRFCFRTFII